MQKLFLLLYIVTTSAGLITLKLGTNLGLPLSFANNKLSVNLNPLTILGISLYGISFLTYVYLISKFDLGYIIPLTAAFVYILVFLASYFVFDELFTITKIIGIGLILSGIIFLNLNK